MIPSSLEEALDALPKVFSSQKDLQDFISQPYKDICLWHHSLGRWMRNNWGLWQGGPLKDYFNNLGIHHPDDMSLIVMKCFWRLMNNHPVELETEVQYYKDYWSKQEVK